MKFVIAAMLASFFGLMAFSQQKTGQSAEATSKSQLASVIESKTREAWQDFKEKKVEAYAAILDDDFTAVESDGKGPHNKKASVDEAKDDTLSSFSFNDFKVIALSANSALATYTVNADATMPDGKMAHSTAAVTEIWVRRAGSWKALRYHESELK